MVFTPTHLTYKMIHALPVFWNHRYNIDEYELSEEESTKVDTKDYYEDDKKHTRERENGETALEILQPCLFCEPPISSQLIYSCTDIFIQLSRTRRRILKTKPITDANRKVMVEIDGIILDFYQHHFRFGKKYPKATLPELVLKKVIVPLEPMNDYYQTKEENKRRAALSGFVVDFFLRMTSMRTNPFFQVNGGKKITKMGRAKCFTCNNLGEFFKYKDYTNFDLLKESTIYNKPIHSEFYFENDEDEEDAEEEDKNEPKPKIKIRVDELSKNSKKKIVERANSDNDNDDDDDDDGDEGQRRKPKSVPPTRSVSYRSKKGKTPSFRGNRGGGGTV